MSVPLPSASAGTPGSGTADGSAWAGFVRTLMIAGTATFAVLFGFLLAIDPYDTGRTGLIGARSVHDIYPFTGNVSRARDPDFDSAVFGNSHVQMLRPERLDALTGDRFVSLAIAGTLPLDALDVLRWFMRNHPSPPRAVVLGIDQFWCAGEAGRSERFPVWLYSDETAAYLAGLVRFRSFEVAGARIKVLRRGRPDARPDGFSDYTPIYEALARSDPEAPRRKLTVRIVHPVNATGRFPALDALERALARLPRATQVVLLRPPVFRTALPEPGTPGAVAADACGAALARVAASRPRIAVVDLLGSYAAEPDDYFNQDHYTDRLARVVEERVAAVLDGADADPTRRGSRLRRPGSLD